MANKKNISYLYKYRNINENTLKTLKNNELYFSFPSEFNDPFDTKIDVNFEGNRADWKRYLLNISPYNSDSKIERILNSFEEYNYNIKELPTFNKEKYFNAAESLIILCLSELNDNILMWTHYANNHKGICLGFKTTCISNSIGLEFEDTFHFNPSKKRGFLPTFKVKYKKERPKPYNPLKDGKEKLFEFAKTKYLDWEYEKERRIIYLYNDIKEKIINFKRDILSEIIFGLKTSEEDINRIKDIVYENYISNGIKVDFYKTELCDGKYGLNIVPFE